MAENESLDLKSVHARRWNSVEKACRSGKSSEDVAGVTRRVLLQGIGMAIKQFENVYKVTLADFLENRGSSSKLDELVRRTKGHDYAKSLVAVLKTQDPKSPASDCINRWFNAVLDRVSDQIGYSLGGSEHYPSYLDTQRHFREVRSEIKNDLGATAAKLAKNPQWKPASRTKRGEVKADPTIEQLHDSVIWMGGPRR